MFMVAMDATEEYPLDINEREHAQYLLQRLDLLRGEKKNCDLAISAEGKKIYVNRDVMRAASGYFDAMFSYDAKEKQEGIVEMKDVTFSALKKSVDFIYTGKISVSYLECEALLHCAMLLKLDEVCIKLSPILERHLTLKCFFNIRRIALKYSLKDLVTVCDEYAVKNLISLAKEDDFNHLELDYLCFLISSKKYFDSRVLDSVLAIALQWIKADLENREKNLIRVVSLIDLSKITPSFNKFLVKEDPLCLRSTEFVKLLRNGLTTFYNVPSLAQESMQVSSDLSPLNPSSSTLSPSSNTLVLFDDSSSLLYYYVPSDKTLIFLTRYQELMSERFTSCFVDGYLYVLTCRKKVLRVLVNQKGSAWEQLDDMLHCHGTYFQCTTKENYIYAGGDNKMERCDVFGNGIWEDVNLSGAICDGSTLVDYDQGIFVIGGYDGLNHESVNTVLKFCPLSSTWTSVKSMTVSRRSASAAVFRSNIYVAGGIARDTSPAFEMYSSVTNAWTVLHDMQSPRWLFSICVVDDQMYAVGSSGDALSIEVYDFHQNQWKCLEFPLNMNVWAPATTSLYLERK